MKKLQGFMWVAIMLLMAGVASADTMSDGLRNALNGLGLTDVRDADLMTPQPDADAYWSLGTMPGSARLLYAGGGDMTFGIYDPLSRVEGQAGAYYTNALTIFDTYTGAGSVVLSWDGAKVVNTATNQELVFIDPATKNPNRAFGFFLIMPNGTRLYSGEMPDRLNTYELANAANAGNQITGQGGFTLDIMPEDKLLAWETGSNGQFDDTLIGIESMTPSEYCPPIEPEPPTVPEPSSLVLLSSALLGLGFAGYRKLRK